MLEERFVCISVLLVCECDIFYRLPGRCTGDRALVRLRACIRVQPGPERELVCLLRQYFFVRLVRVKTTDQQGLNYPDEDITTCPIFAIAIALAMQSVPCSQLLEHVRPVPTQLNLEAMETLPLTEILLQAGQPHAETIVTPDTVSEKKLKSSAHPGIHNQINHLLARVSKQAGVQTSLSSHSFRRGGQHANGEPGKSISDRGGRNLSSSQKVWPYVFNTTQDDQRVAKVLSGWASTARAPLNGLGNLDSAASGRVRVFQTLLFNTCTGLQDARLNVCLEVLNACTSRLLRPMPTLRLLTQPARLPSVWNVVRLKPASVATRCFVSRWPCRKPTSKNFNGRSPTSNATNGRSSK